jgi:hypothetical protein
VRNPTLHELLQTFTSEAAGRLSMATAQGEEIPFEVVESDAGRRGAPPLYCYRPLTDQFIRERLGLLVGLSSYPPVARALEVAEGTSAYLSAMGESRISERPRDRADAALRCFLGRLFAERSEFALEPDRFAAAYDELERALYQGLCVFEVVAPLFGVSLEPGMDELVISSGLSLMRAGALTDPPDLDVGSAANTAERPDESGLLLVLRVPQERWAHPPVAEARARFRRVLAALRLFERGGFALGSVGFTRIDGGTWRPVAMGGAGRVRGSIVIEAVQEDEFRAFCNLIARRLPDAEASSAGELAWALSRFEMGCERPDPFDALTDYLLALRALLEPEGPTSGRLASRLSVICAAARDRAALARRTAQAIALERAVMTGISVSLDPDCTAAGLVDEMAEHLRAILRDALCGHLDSDVRLLADELLAEAAAVPA